MTYELRVLETPKERYGNVNFLRRFKMHIPERFRDQLPHRGMKLAVHYRGNYAVDVSLYLVPRNELHGGFRVLVGQAEIRSPNDGERFRYPTAREVKDAIEPHLEEMIEGSLGGV